MNILTKYLSILKKYETIAASLVVVAITLLLSYFLLLPNFMQSRQIISQQKKLNARLSLIEQKDKALSALNETYYKENFAKMNLILPSSKDYISLFDRLDELQLKTGVVIMSTNFQLGVISTGSATISKVAGMQSSMIPLTFEAVGDISSIKNFIDSLKEISGRFISLDSVSWTFKENMVRANFNARAYYYPLSQTIGSIDSPIPKMSKNNDSLLQKISQLPAVVPVSESFSSINVGKKDLFN